MTSRLLAMSAAVIVLGGAPVVAQTNDWIPTSTAYSTDDYRTSYADAQRQAYDNGYRDGLKRGEQAARDRKAVNVEIERDYRSADNGYNRSFGDRDRYRDNYRGGFTQGYRDGYGRYGSNGAWNNRGWARSRDYRYESGYGSAGYGAYQNGVSDGYNKGLDDVHDRKFPDVTRQKWYRNGDHDYNSRYGSKDAYRVEYRRGFEEGYNRAYRDGRRF
jgi:hypothetical protein